MVNSFVVSLGVDVIGIVDIDGRILDDLDYKIYREKKTRFMYRFRFDIHTRCLVCKISFLSSLFSIVGGKSFCTY